MARIPATPWSRRNFLAVAGAAAGGAAAGLPRVYLPKLSAPAAFPAGFVWGAGSSAYQIEGAANEDGKSASVWDEFVRRPGTILDGQTGARACDFYRRYAEDVALMRRMELGAFRFSLAWTRILPEGTGAVNQRGLDFYRRLVDALLAAGIEPIATLFHWDTPVALEERGGWQTPEMADWFAEYAAVAARALGDRVRTWLTINEPRSFIGGGYVAGVQAPGLQLPRREALAAAHVVLLAHGKAVAALRANAGAGTPIGIPSDITPALPESAGDAEAASAATWTTDIRRFTGRGWWDENAWWLDPIYKGAYPEAALAALGADAPRIEPGDMAAIAAPLDFLAANVYGGRRLRSAWPAGFARAGNGWEVTPEALYWAPKWLHERYGKPIYVTENGCALPDWIALDGAVHDALRVDFTARYLRALAQAMSEGTPVSGYLHWALLDNFEWQQGYTQRFGLVYVDFPTGRRIVKDSARWFATARAGA